MLFNFLLILEFEGIFVEIGKEVLVKSKDEREEWGVNRGNQKWRRMNKATISKQTNKR